MEKFWELLGWGCFIALLMGGWPKLPNVTIHKHYHVKGKREVE